MQNFPLKNTVPFLFFGGMAVFFILAFIFWTATPYLQMKSYFNKKRSGQIEQILKTDFIFSPYTIAQSLIRTDLLNYFSLKYIKKSDIQLFNKAIAYSEDLLNHDKFDYYRYVYLAMAYSKKGDVFLDKIFTDKAEIYFKKAIDFSPTRQELYYAYGQFLWDHGRIREAEETFRYALKLGDQAIFSHFYLGLILVESGESNYEEALDQLEFFFTSSLRKDFEISTYNPDLGWGKSKNAYVKILNYFYSKRDKEKVIKIANRLAEIDEPQSASFRRIIDIINTTGQLPNIEFESR